MTRTEAMTLKTTLVRLVEKMPRFVSFDAGVVAGLFGIGLYIAVVSRHWIAALFLILGAAWMISIPIRLRLRRPDRP
jgi:hypothetical protein